MFIECYHKIHKDLKVKGFLDYHSCAELENIVAYNVSEVLEGNDIIYNNEIEYLCIYAHGSRVFGNPRKNSDIDFVLFYKGTIHEDTLFNIFADENIYIEHIKCDFNPIQIDDDSDIEHYILKHDIEYHLKPILEKKINLAFALDDFDDEEIQGQINGKVKHGISTKEYLDLMDDVVDLGLPSGTLWCKYNLDVDPNYLTKAEDWYGGYYAWGELKQKASYEYDNYIYTHSPKCYDDSKSDYNLPISLQEFKLTELLPEDDAAYLNKKLYNFKFHIPTKELCEELLKYTKNYWVNNYDPNKIVHNPENDGGILGLNGLVFEGKNENLIFIPAAGFQISLSNDEIGYVACIRSANLRIDKNKESYILYCWANQLRTSLYSGGRCWGMSIRPVINL